MLAAEGAKVVVNDLGGARDGQGAIWPAHDVVAEIKAAGGEAVANGADVSDWTQAKGMTRPGGLGLRKPGRADQQSPASCATACW